MRKYRRSAFTLVELLAVIAIIAILATLSYVYFANMLQKGRDSKRITEISQIQNALLLYYRDEGSYPDSLDFGGALVGSTSSTTYMAIVPQNPTPRNDGNCPDEEFVYATSTSANGRSEYSLGFCLAEKSADLNPGCSLASPSGIISTPCLPGNMLLWLDASDGATLYADQSCGTIIPVDGIPVGCWKDKSGNGYNALQSTAASRPLYTENILNGEPVIRFDGSDDYMNTSFFPSPLSQLTIFVVSSVDNDGAVFDGLASRLSLSQWVGTFALYAGSPVAYSASTPRASKIYTCVFNGNNSLFYENSTLKVAGNVGANSMDGLSVGWLGTETNYELDGDISEIIIYDTILSEIERQQVEDYLNDKYNIY
jgi:prepilin-type N-terminal cleavage/methylation domain-containing protein